MSRLGVLPSAAIIPSAALSNSHANVYPKLKGFTIGQLNIASLIKHIEEIQKSKYTDMT
jgi:hypothetical protein